MGHPIRATRRRRRVITAFGLGAALACLGLAGSAIGASGSGVLTSGIAYIGQAPVSSPLVYNSGFGHDKVFGNYVLEYVTKAVGNPNGSITVKSKSLTLYTTHGSLSGTGSAVLTVTNKPHPFDATVTNGKFFLNHGTGRYAGHSFRAAFEGKGNIGLPATANSAGYGDYFTFRYKGVYR